MKISIRRDLNGSDVGAAVTVYYSRSDAANSVDNDYERAVLFRNVLNVFASKLNKNTLAN